MSFHIRSQSLRGGWQHKERIAGPIDTRITASARRQCREGHLPARHPLRVLAVIRVELESGEVEVLITSLPSDTKALTPEWKSCLTRAQLYDAVRWGIEGRTSQNAGKSNAWRSRNFSGRSPWNTTVTQQAISTLKIFAQGT